ncbi:olfactomedin-like protein 2A isoform X3 [Ostrea edulis]|uniref:olfactomedin-like protein 2A isoform X3 n=1 Tax=Ostrea edulis TaxID=37623 RepID=UPI0024AEDD14|nr:olfactomedin-like protein 2A isoform X3 [Ostrea edulis]
MDAQGGLTRHIKIIYLLIAVNTFLTGILFITSRDIRALTAHSDQTINIYKSYANKLRGKTSRLRRSNVYCGHNVTIDYSFCKKVVSDCDLRTPAIPGPKGEKGEPGIDGKGVKGCRGEKGDEGIPGLPGEEGKKGDAGLSGLPGLPGVSGEKGDMGSPGLQGSRGYPGYRGEKGQKGEQGTHGHLGHTGKQGEPGPKGDHGDSGQKGERGIPGSKGEKGAVGPNGYRGYSGPKGEKGNSGMKGVRGDPGPKGNKGATGRKGRRGEMGPKGGEGEKGAAGETWSPSSNDTCLCSCTYLGTPKATTQSSVTEEAETTTDIVACSPTSTTSTTTTTEPTTTSTTTTTTTTTPVPTTPKPRKSYCVIKKIGIPFFKRQTVSLKGSWMRDQLMNPQKIWVTDGISGQYLKEYFSVGDFKANRVTTTYNLTQFTYQGTNHIVYNGTFCYHWKGTLQIVCYDLRLQAIVMAFDVENANYEGDTTLYKGSNSYFDLEADDNGAWLLYSEKNDLDNIYVIQFYPGTLREYRRIKVPVKVQQYGNGFISCGILYLVTSSTAQRTSIEFAYDLFKLETLPITLGFINPFADSSMISFFYDRNPRNCRILGWDSGRQIDYQILFQ